MACGVFGVYAPGEDVARLSYFGVFALQHRGQESAGIAVSDGKAIVCHKDMGLVFQVFTEERLGQLKGDIAIGHNRYSTTGSSIIENAQPIIVESAKGKSLALAHNGNLVNAKELRDRMLTEGFNFEGTSDSEVIARMIGSYLQKDLGLVEAITETMSQIVGAYSLVILTRTKLVAVRDPWGIRPLCLGKIDGGWVIASETCALQVVGAEFEREIEPGEIVIIDENGPRSFKGREMICRALCVFEFIYLARPDSEIYDFLLHTCRRHMGEQLAIEYPIDADIVIPVPDTGWPAAIGFAAQSGIPFNEGLIRNRYILRTFIQPDQRQRELGIRIKLVPLRREIAGKRLVVGDDSIVRGTTFQEIVGVLKEFGQASEVHARITAPPYRYPCYYGIDTGARAELIAAKYSVEEIRKHIGADSLGYLSEEGLIGAIGLPRNLFCMACFNGKYPIPIEGYELGKSTLES